MDSESKRHRLLDALRHLTPDMKETLRSRKEEGGHHRCWPRRTSGRSRQQSGSQNGDPPVQVSSEEVEKNNRLSSTDLVALSNLPRTLAILEKTLNKEVKDTLARFSGNKIKRTPTNLMRQICEDEGYFVYAPLTGEMDFDCYVGFGISGPDDYPTIVVGLHADPQAVGSEVAIAAIKRISSLADWHDNLANHAGWPEVWRETSLLHVLQHKDHVASVKRFFIESINQLEEALTTFKKKSALTYPETWTGPEVIEMKIYGADFSGARNPGAGIYYA
jgi:hypothetical protein